MIILYDGVMPIAKSAIVSSYSGTPSADHSLPSALLHFIRKEFTGGTGQRTVKHYH